MLLERHDVPAIEAVERLVGLQAQVNNPPYIGLWTRLKEFRRDDLTRLIEERRVVRAALMRSTLHLMTAGDYLRLQPALRPALIRALSSFFGKRARGLDIERLVSAAREELAEPRSFAELRDSLSKLEPGRDPQALAYAVRSYLPLVQVFPGGTWGSGGRVAYALAGPWLGGSVSDPGDAGELVKRYLAAFGPSSVKDVQAWAGMTRLKETVEKLKPGLVSFRGEAGNELLDLPDAPRPSGESAAPVRFVPEYDNLVLSHADRTRVLPEAYRSKVLLSAGRVRATILVDGFVRGAWRIEKSRGAATLVIEPFAPISASDRDALRLEAERLIRFVHDDGRDLDVRFAGAT